MSFFISRKNSILFSRYLDFCVFVKYRIENLSRHHSYCYIMEVTLMLILLNPKYYQNEIWFNASALYEKHF